MISLIVGIAIFAVLLLFGTPIFMSMACGGIWIILFALGSPGEAVVQKMVSSIDVFSFMAIAPFILAGTIMTFSGFSRSLVDMAESLVGRIFGGLGVVSVLACAVFAAMCGSTLATSAAVGSVLLDPMSEKGYPKSFSTAILATAGTLGIMIPPSICFVIYGGITEQSVPALFMAGVLPGIIMTVMLAVVAMFIGWRKGFVSGRSFTWRERGSLFVKSLPALSLIPVIMVPIYTGIATPTESAAISVVYAVLIGILYYKAVKWRQLSGAVVDSARSTAMIMIIVSCGLLFGTSLVSFGVAETISNFLVQSNFAWWQFLLLVNVIWFLLGCVMESTAVMVIMVPLIASSFGPLGINPIHFGVLSVLNTELALITPPVGMNLFVMSNLGKVPVDTVIRGIWPFVGLFVIALILITYIPEISLVLPRAMDLIK